MSKISTKQGSSFHVIVFRLLFLCSILLIASCAEKSSDDDLNTPIAISAKASVDSLEIDLSKSHTVEFEITTEFNNNSTRTEKLTISWDADSENLSVTDSQNNPVKINYDVDDLFAGPSTVSISDEIFPEEIEIVIELISIELTSEDTVVELKVFSPKTTLILGETVSLSLSALYDDGSSISDATSIAKCVGAADSSAVITVNDLCEIEAIGEGRTTISAELKTPQSSDPTVQVLLIEVISSPTISMLMPSFNQNQLETGKQYTFTLSATNSDNQVIADARSVAKCVDASDTVGIISVTPNCVVTVGSELGQATVSAEILNPESQAILPTVIAFNFEVVSTLPTVETIAVSHTMDEMIIGEIKEFALTVTMSDGTIHPNPRSIANCRKGLPVDFISVSNDCIVTAIRASNGQSVTVTAEFNGIQDVAPTIIFYEFKVIATPPTIDELTVNYANDILEVGSSIELGVTAVLSNGSTITDARSLVRCVDTSVETDLVNVTEDCNLTALKLGNGSVSVELLDPQLETYSVVPLAFTIIDLYSSVAIDIAPETISHSITLPAIEPGIYKVKVIVDDVAQGGPVLLGDSLEFAVFTSDSQLPQCLNFLHWSKRSIACGVALSETNDVVVSLFGLPDEGFVGRLYLMLDNDILVTDDKGIAVAGDISDYVLLNPNTTYESGHVYVNERAASQSRYYFDRENGLSATASSYHVRIDFQADEQGLYHFDEDTVTVGWQFNTSSGLPINYCNFDVGLAGNCLRSSGESYIEITVNASLEDLFIIVSGEFNQSLIPSPATADGELTYSITLTNN